MLHALATQSRGEIFLYKTTLPSWGMENHVSFRRAHRLQYSFDGIETRFEPDVISVSGIEHSTQPGNRPEAMTRQPADKATNTVVGLLFKELKNVGGCEQSKLFALQPDDINLQNAIRTQDAAPIHEYELRRLRTAKHR